MGSAPSKQVVEAGAQEKLAEALRAMELRNERDIVEKDYVYVQSDARESNSRTALEVHLLMTHRT